MLTQTKNQDVIDIVTETKLQHIAVIMDGNRRWAKEKFLPSAVGHQKGVTSLKKVVTACKDFGVKYITVYAFSTENWNRPQEEVSFLMELFAKTIANELSEMYDEGVRIRFLGDLSRASDGLRQIIRNAEDRTKNNTGVNLQIAFNYGARMELIQAVKTIATKIENKEFSVDEINEQMISDNLYTSGMPDPDLMIRTGGEMRISNYLLWQLAYSELYITEQYWPEFDENSLAESILEFGHRNRRFGK